MSCTCVVGLQWGDEAKGKIVDLLAEEHAFVVRYNGGDQRGPSAGTRVGELLRRDRLRERLRWAVPRKNRVNRALAGDGAAVKPFDPDQVCDEYVGYAERLRPFITDAAYLLHDGLKAGKRVL